MILKIRIPRPLFSGSRAGLTPLAIGPARGATFSATLSDCMDDWIVRQTPARSSEAARPAAQAVARPVAHKPRKEAGAGGMMRAFSWLQSKYAMTATKRLRVAETVSLGEKRFVALISVEGREFLIGGGSAGVSLLTALDSVSKGGLRSGLGDAEDAE
jgi:hypothetical protein